MKASHSQKTGVKLISSPQYGSQTEPQTYWMCFIPREPPASCLISCPWTKPLCGSLNWKIVLYGGYYSLLISFELCYELLIIFVNLRDNAAQEHHSLSQNHWNWCAEQVLSDISHLTWPSDTCWIVIFNLLILVMWEARDTKLKVVSLQLTDFLDLPVNHF